MRVLHLTTDSEIGGAERLLIHTARSRSTLGHEPIFCTLRQRGPFHRAIEECGATALSLGVRNGLGMAVAVRTLLRLLDEYRVDLLHTHLYHAGVLAWAASRLGTIPARIHTRHYELFFHTYGKPWDVILDRRATCAADHVVAISEAVRRALVNVERVPDGRVSVIYNGIAVPPNRRSPAGGGTTANLIAVGSLHPWKGHRVLIEALALVCRQVPTVRLQIFGEGAERPALWQRARSLGLEGVVDLPGFATDVTRHLAEADLMVHPSLDEGLGISLLEGMSQECPVVASRVGGIPEVVEDGVNGLLVPPADPASLAAAITTLLRDQDRRRTMGVEGRRRLERLFTVEAMLGSYATLYERFRISEAKPARNGTPRHRLA